MSLKVDLGLFNLDFTDYHAILGVPVDADPKDIRKQYLKIARRLHPDSCAKESSEERQRAAELLSKLVNPAYEKLSQEKNYTEYCILLKLQGQKALRQQDTVMLVSDTARKLASATGEIDVPYRAALRELTEKQYDHLNRSLELIGHISELNLVYLMRKAKESPIGPPPAMRPESSGSTGSTKTPKPSEGPSTKQAEPIVEAYLRRAKEFSNKQEYTKAIQELREAIKIAPSNSKCQSSLGEVYLKMNQATMAKIHFNQALKLDPQDQVALDGLQKLDPKGNSGGGSSGAGSAKKPSKPGPKPPAGGKPNQSSGGLFGLFGGKKK